MVLQGGILGIGYHLYVAAAQALCRVFPYLKGV